MQLEQFLTNILKTSRSSYRAEGEELHSPIIRLSRRKGVASYTKEALYDSESKAQVDEVDEINAISQFEF
ncbi:hypothetical protein QTJ16_001483 [Diplocarpon rosae]|uniref:Uncharacterized protein n=1 Tax=Diplocarpon rosae TaxID=946125 RepID=A0AAD9WEH3_9HELO|nr:hypothetical protein QTJ16_001483 [Diplocarpon rosae]